MNAPSDTHPEQLLQSHQRAKAFVGVGVPILFACGALALHAREWPLVGLIGICIALIMASYLALLKGCILRPKADHCPFWLVLCCLGLGMEVSGAGQGLDSGELDSLALGGDDARPEELFPPFPLPQGLAGSGQ